jgi:hypothetical protein
MRPNDYTDRHLPPVRYTERTHYIAWLSFIFAAYYIFRSYRIYLSLKIYGGSGTPVTLEFVVTILIIFCLIFGGIQLLREKSIGKKAIVFSAKIGLITILAITLWAISLLWVGPYSTDIESVIANAFKLFFRYTLRYAYLIMAGFIILNKTNEELGLG